MKKSFFLLFLCVALVAKAQQPIVIATNNVNLIFKIGENKKLYQAYFGEKLISPADIAGLPLEKEAYIPAGTDNLFEPAVRVIHNDGNPSLDLRFIGTKSKTEAGVTETKITLKDPKYPVEIILHFTSFFEEDVIKTRTEIKHSEKKPLVLTNYSSAMLHFNAPEYWLTQFHGDWAEEMKQEESKLTAGIKVIDSKLGTRANMYQSPVFFLSPGGKSTETTGELIAGTLGWTGNFKFNFEIDEVGALRLSAGINPFASEYKLASNKPFITPEFIFAYSNKGKGLASRNLHNWARNYGVLDGKKPRMTLLNNWEATYFDFDEKKLSGLFTDAKNLGVDMFLLDDGWFANKYPRNNDNAGLGDWQENKAKLPNGLGYLVKDAESKGIKFGIWLEPEMVNPKSELYEKHPDWVLKLPNREEHYYRNQLVLDLTNPQVQDFVYKLVDDMMMKNPGIAYIKWDCNRMMTNTYSPYLKENQSQVYIDYVKAFYSVLERLRVKYPHLPIMLCSGGGGRTDYGALKYFTEFWPSDNTDPYERVFIQWDYSYFFPSLTMACHITSWGKQSLKFKSDVAMQGRLGYDIEVEKMKPEELKFSQQVVADYKRLSNVIWQGDLHRLVSPYEGNHASLMYVNKEKNKSVLYAYNLHTRYNESVNRVKLQGLNAEKQYKVEEINLFPGTNSQFSGNGKTFSGDYLMKVGLPIFSSQALTSSVFEITAQ